MKIERFEDIEIWQLARVLVKDIYLLTQNGLISKDFRFCNQIQSAALSVMNKISKGFEGRSNKEFVRFLFISKCSCGEVRSMLYVALDIGYIDQEIFIRILEQAETISKSLSGFIKYLEK